MTGVLELHPAPGHPGAVVSAVHEALDGVVVDGLRPDQYAATIAELARARSRLHALELELVAAAEKARVADEAGCSSTGAWLSQQTRSGGAAAARAVKLATDLHDRLPVTTEALSEGTVSREHASAIAHATSRLPAGLTDEQVATVEASLVARARRVDPVQLRRLARRALAAVEDDASVVDAHEDAQLRDEEAAARDRTRLTLHDNGDGTTSGHFTVPTLAASILRKALDAMTAPRRGRLGASRTQGGGARVDRDLGPRPRPRLHRSARAPADRPAPRQGSPPPSWSPSISTPSAGSSAPPASTPATSFPPPRHAAWPARRDWSPPCSAAGPSRSTSDAPAGSSRRPSASPAPPATPAAPPTAATSRTPGAPPPTAVELGRSDRPGRHGAALRPPPPQDPRPWTPPPAAAGRLDPLQQADVGHLTSTRDLLLWSCGPSVGPRPGVATAGTVRPAGLISVRRPPRRSRSAPVVRRG